MNAFDLLHPAIQHHIVNSFGWSDLRPFQKAVVRPILAGRHMLVVAPTAGGKTEAALFPVLSRMLDADWRRLSLLYICPIKALLNNLDARLHRCFTLVGRRSALWHGDIAPSARKNLLRDPPDCLLTTPESLEVMLTSPNVDHRLFLADVRVTVIDEVHAFAGDDRGWHLLAVLERISRIAGRDIQRIGLSATVGNADELARWLRAGSPNAYEVRAPSATAVHEADVTVDFVGDLDNAAIIISRLHRGEKRLVFTDSRNKAERLAAALRDRDVAVFVTHSSLSADQRHRAENAFSERADCVIVATSVLELGIDVGDLDRVVQIDAPGAVSSFMQRMGRTGRRPGTRPNCLFLATSSDSLLRACALASLREAGYVEPLRPPPLPFHVFTQQLMALALQERGIGVDTWREWIGDFCETADLDDDRMRAVVRFMMAEDILWSDQGLLWFGREGEAAFGRRHFMELLSMVAGDPLFSVLHGRDTIGRIHPLSFLSTDGDKAVILLGGRSWGVRHIDWNRKTVHVAASALPGRSRWLGGGMWLGHEVSQAIRALIQDGETSKCWSRRASEKILEIREGMPWLEPGATVFEFGDQGVRWWTFAGDAANRTLSETAKALFKLHGRSDGLSVLFRDGLGGMRPAEWIASLKNGIRKGYRPAVDERWLEGLKFSRCLPRSIAEAMLRERFSDPAAVKETLSLRPISVFNEHRR